MGNKNISINDLYILFKGNILFKGISSQNPDGEINNVLIYNDNNILNSQISENETLKYINNLKINKACSNDGYTYEYIKATAHEMMLLYVTIST